MPDFNYNIPLNGYGQLRYNPQMPQLAQMGQGPGNIANQFLPNGMMPMVNPQVNAGSPAYTMQAQRQFGNIDYQHIQQSQMLQGIGGWLKQQNQARDFRTYNRTQSDPLKMIPQNSNTSQQSLYGEQGMRWGGRVKMDLGGDPEINAKNVASAKASGLGDAFSVDHINSILAGTSNRISGYGGDMDKLAMQAYLWREQNKSRDPQQTIQGFFGRPISSNDPTDVFRQKLASIGQGPGAMYNSTPDQTVRKKQGGKVKFDGGGRFDDFDNFDEDDFEDLKDELDKFFKEKGDTPQALLDKEENGEDKQDKQDAKPDTSQDEDQPMSHEAINFMNNIQSDDKDDDDDKTDENGNYVSGPGVSLSTPEPSGPRTALNSSTLTPPPQSFSTPVNGSAMPDMSGHPLIEAFKNGIAKVENAGYTEGNKNSSAFGRYQFTAPTLEAVREMQFSNIPKQQFVDTYKSDPKFQERVMDAYSAHLLQKYPDPHMAATAFYLGEGKANYYNQPDYNPGHGNIPVGKYLNTFDQGYKQRQGGHIMNKPEQINLNFREGGEYEMSDAQINLLKSQGYDIEIIK
jgi:hypothetical protein